MIKPSLVSALIAQWIEPLFRGKSAYYGKAKG